MLIPVSILPMGSLALYSFNYVELKNINFLNLLNYVSLYPKKSTNIEKFFYRYSFWKEFVREAEYLYLPDLFFLEAMAYRLYIDEDLEYSFNYQCPVCGANNKMSFFYKDVEYINFENINFEHKFGDVLHFTVSYPIGSKIESRLPKYMREPYINFMNLDLALLMVSVDSNSEELDRIERLILGATHKDALIMMSIMRYLRSILEVKTHRCTSCGSNNPVDISSLFDIDMFAAIEPDDLLKYKAFLNKNNIYDIENHSFKNLYHMYKILSDENKDKTKVNIKLDEKGVRYKT